MKLDAFIPGFLKKIDTYLLKHHPNLWITNVHYVLFYTLILDVVLFALANMFGYSLTDDIPDVEVPLMLMILPAILVFVFWFIKQARYNVDKNFGRSNLLHDYQNFIVYFVVIFLFYSVAAIIPHSLIYKVQNAVSTEELNEDIDKLNTGYVYFTGYGIEENDNVIEIESRSEYVYQYDRYYSYPEEYEEYEKEIVSKETALLEIEDFIKIYNKYTVEKIVFNPQEVLKKALKNESIDLYYSGDYYYSYNENVDWKLQKMYRIHNGNYGYMLSDSDYLKVIFALVGMLALITWIFKNVHWKNFLAAGITVILSPFIMALVGLILFVVLDVSNSFDEEAILIVIILFNLVAFLWFIIPYAQQRYSYMSVINGVLLQGWAPFSVFVYSALLIQINRHNYYYNDAYYDYWEYWESYLENTYWLGWGVAILSIALMKPFYKRMWALPKGK